MVFSFFTRNKWSKLVSIILLLIFSNPIVANLGLKYLEKKYPISDLTEIKKVDSIVVLSGMLKLVELDNKKIIYEFSESVDRYEAGIQLMKMGKSSKIIFTRGYLPWSIGIPEGDHLKKIAIERGINEENVFLTGIVKNTEEEAMAIKKLIKTEEKIALVTSSFHMPRALKLFLSNGIKVIPVSVDQRATNQKITFLSFLPSSGALDNNSLVVRELLGRIYYSLKTYLF